jgi:hypothetical protein
MVNTLARGPQIKKSKYQNLYNAEMQKMSRSPMIRGNEPDGDGDASVFPSLGFGISI